MRLFKFLVISNEVMKKTKVIKPIVCVRMENKKGTLKFSKGFKTKNEFFLLL